MTAPSTNARAGFLIVLLAMVFTFGLIRSFSIRFATGDVYPPYSSMRATPDGAKLLYDALARTPGITVARNYFPLDYLEESHAAILFLNLNLGELATEFAPYDRLANRGNRVVASLDWQGKETPKADDLEKHWHLKFALDKRGLYFAEAPGWRVLDRDGARILAIETQSQKGSLVLFAGSRDFSNRATVDLDHLPIVSTALGENSRVVFDEVHFGIAESGTVVGLARRFRLSGMALGLALCAALFIWKNSASFPPAAAQPRTERMAGRTSISGLVTLLRRHIKPADLAAVCWNEWLTANRNDLSPARKERAEAILRERARQPLEAVREIQTVLHSKGPL